MLYEAVYHEADSNYCFPISGNEITLRLRVSNKDKFKKVKVIYGNKYDYYIKQNEIEMSLKYQTKLYDFYEVTIKLWDVRFVYIFSLEEEDKTYYYCEDGVMLKYDFNFAYFNCFQFPYINEVDVPKRIDWLKNRVFYEVFIDRFNLGNKDKDLSYINLKVDEIPKPTSFFGGDLKGITNKLNYFKELGINALYLTPIFKSISNHKYDISDYYNVDKQFGSKEDLKELITKAHELDIKIILDAVFNHCSDQIMQFQDVLKNGKRSKYFNWFIIHGDKVDQEKVNYEIFSICNYLPKFNTSNEEVKKYLIEIGKYYVKEFNIDGWRLDVADELSHDFWHDFRKEVKKINPNCLLVAENWHNSYPFLRGDQFDSIMNYSFTKAVLDYLALNNLDAKETAYQLNAILLRNNDIANDMMLNLLDTHDTDRFYTSCNKDIDLLICALSLQFMFKGNPGIYYGIEIPLEGGYDPDNRRPMNFNKISYDSSLYKILKDLIKLRTTNDVLGYGDIFITSNDDLLIIDRSKNSRHLKLIINHSGRNKKISNTNIILCHNFSNNILKDKGFIIMEDEK